MILFLVANLLHVRQKPQKLQHLRLQFLFPRVAALQIPARPQFRPLLLLREVLKLRMMLRRGDGGEEKRLQVEPLLRVFAMALAFDFLHCARVTVEARTGREALIQSII